MIYLFTGNNEFLIHEKTSSWKKQFGEKYSYNNLTHIKSIADTDIKTLSEELLHESLFVEKKLIIIENIPLQSSIKDTSLILKQELILSIIEKISANNIVLFSSVSPDKRGKLYKKIQKLAKEDHSSVQIQTYELKDDGDIITIIQSKYADLIDYQAIHTLIRYKSGNLTKIIAEIEKLLIAHDTITVNLVHETLVPEFEENIFECIHNLVAGKTQETIQNIQVILEQSDIMPFYYGLIANLRTIVYISLLQNRKFSPQKISATLQLGKREFLIQKYSGIKYSKIKDLYLALLKADAKMKLGQLSPISKHPLQDEIECIILTAPLNRQ